MTLVTSLPTLWYENESKFPNFSLLLKFENWQTNAQFCRRHSPQTARELHFKNIFKQSVNVTVKTKSKPA